jgi:hypothetical protein
MDNAVLAGRIDLLVGLVSDHAVDTPVYALLPVYPRA